jgi:hypothetical protein
MSFGLGVLAGIGGAQREWNVRSHEESLAAEKQKNEATVNMLHDFLLRDDVTPETRQAALSSLMQFSQTPGIPTQKHRSVAMEGMFTAFNQPRDYVSPDVAATRAQGQTDKQLGGGMVAAAIGGGPTSPFPSIPAFGSPGMDLSARGTQETATPGETRHGFLGSDEMAVKKGHAAGLQTRSMLGAMGVTPGSSGSSGAGTEMTIGPDGKPHIINISATRENYPASDGSMRSAIVYHNGSKAGQAVDAETGQPVYSPRWQVGRYQNIDTLDNEGNRITHRVSNFEGGDFEKPTPSRVIAVKHADNTVTYHSYNPITQEIGDPVISGVVQTGPQLARTEAGITSTNIGTQIKKGTYKATIDTKAFPEMPTPAGLPLVDTVDGQQPVGTRLFAATKEPGSVLQRASTGRVVVQHAEDTARMVEDPKNAEFFGKVAGRISDLKTDGPSAFGYKLFGPIGTNDPRLTQLHGAIKSVSDLLTTVHGRRAEESARNFERSLAKANSPAALAAILRQYGKIAEEVAAEGSRSIVPVSGSSRVPAGPTAAPTYRYVPGKGAVPISASPPAPK